MDEKMEFRLQMMNISKAFGGVQALDNAQLQVRPGEIHSLVGENGAGKSTLIKVLSGAHQPDSGKIILDGEEVVMHDPSTAIKMGVGVIYQEYMLATAISIAENIYIDNLTGGNKHLINWNDMNERAKKLLDSLGFGELNPRSLVKDLTVAEQQVVEICKALSRNVKILVLDEPTSVLTFAETEKLIDILYELKKQGVSIIYISHRLEEVIRISDKITVMKDGKYVDTVSGDIDKNHLMELMIGRELKQMFPERNAKIGETALEAKHITAGNKVKDVSFYIRQGEVVGFAGLVGAGRTETMRSIFGADPMDSGEVIYFGEKMRFRNPGEAVAHGLGLISENRKEEGVVLSQSIRSNTTLTNLNQCKNKAGFLDLKKEKGIVQNILKKIATKYNSVEDPVSSLSGGNQQKISLAKWLGANCRVIIFDEPTRGVDVGAKVEIFSNINYLVESGVAVIMISSEMNEIIGMCDRAYVMHNGKIVGELSKEELTESNLIKLQMEG